MHVALIAALAITGAACAQDASARPTTRLAPSCLRTTGGQSACRLILSFFDALGSGRFETACSVLGRALWRETGGRNCSHVVAMSQDAPFEIVGANSSNPGHVVVVKVGMHELDHFRTLTWAVLVGREDGRLRILDTRRIR